MSDRPETTGNTAALRDALIQCELFLGNVSRHGHPTLNPGDKCTACDGVDELRGMVDAALAAPARNCDRFADEVDAQLAFLNEVWLISVTRETMLERDKFDNWTCEMRSEFAHWLLAPEGKEASNG